jgi:hypothetical protein
MGRLLLSAVRFGVSRADSVSTVEKVAKSWRATKRKKPALERADAPVPAKQVAGLVEFPTVLLSVVSSTFLKPSRRQTVGGQAAFPCDSPAIRVFPSIRSKATRTVIVNAAAR